MSDPVALGLCLTMSISLGNITAFLLFTFTEVSKGKVAIDTLDSFIQDKSHEEKSYDRPAAPKNWPEKGLIRIEELCLKYYGVDKLVLDHVSLSVNPGEKVALFGRTGSGKSSTVKTILKLYLPDTDTNSSQYITIDDLNVKDVGCLQLRQQLGVISQEPILLRGTLRYNLDPRGKHTDEEILEAVKAVDLTDLRTEASNILDLKVDSSGSNTFSLGQRQLICLARVLLQKPVVLLMDEATANLDHKTEEVINKVVLEQLKNTTVIAITHREKSVAGFDRNIEMASGKIISDQKNLA